MVSEALGTIAGIESQTNQVGGNDTEREQFTILKRDVELVKITPEEGNKGQQQYSRTKIPTTTK